MNRVTIKHSAGHKEDQGMHKQREVRGGYMWSWQTACRIACVVLLRAASTPHTSPQAHHLQWRGARTQPHPSRRSPERALVGLHTHPLPCPTLESALSSFRTLLAQTLAVFSAKDENNSGSGLLRYHSSALHAGKATLTVMEIVCSNRVGCSIFF